MDPAIGRASSRYLDKLLVAESPAGEPMVLHVEFQTAGEADMGPRMFEYAGSVCRVPPVCEWERIRIEPVVVYLDRDTYRPDPGEFVLLAAGGRPVVFPYRVLRLWEEDPAPLLATGSPWLLPFVPLMDVGERLGAVIECGERIQRASISREEKRDLLVCMGALAGRVIDDWTRLRDLVMEDDMAESAFVKHWIDQGREQGRQQEREQSLAREADMVLRVLSSRFGSVPEDVADRVRASRDFDRLQELIESAARAATIEAFRTRL
jgi:hypothetical protein